ncbi:acyltransferase family protein [Actinokineospora xionganensis]|uniref:Acyltransferase n=1 Tax=Actinokineospora xionganensis TaxID=2684470 RepID=A0ABR7L8K9_9PSEU|nr:acyltransferase [Actinokineospora xionganensis]MBC6449041.1 acyltransferase [Actinokineospora xionganensis]
MSTTTPQSEVHSPEVIHDRLPSLTGVRFFAALAVVVVHLVSTQAIFANTALQKAFGATIPFATSAVSIFFVLSGFVLTWSARSSDAPARFLRRRFVKIFPNHLVTWALAVLFILLFGTAHLIGTSGAIRWDATLANLFLVHVWVPDPSYISSANAPAWSLACEAFFYLLFPLLFVAVRRISRERLRRWAVVTTLVSLSVPCFALLLTGSHLAPELPIPTLQLWFGYLFPLTRLPEFLLGMLLARIVREGVWRPTRMRWAVLALFGSIVVSLTLPPIFFFGPFYAAAAGLLVATLATRDITGAPSRLRGRAMIFLGDRSYALYMSHFVVIAFARHLFFPAGGLSTVQALLALFLVVLPIALVASFLLYAGVERPLYRRFANPQDKVAV